MTTDDEILRRLRDANPIQPDDLVPGEATERFVRSLRPRERRPSRAVVWTAAAIAACIFAYVVTTSVGTPRRATAAEVLRETSGIAASQEVAAGGRFVYLRRRAIELTTNIVRDAAWSAAQLVAQETWFASDGSGRIVATFGPVIFFGPRDKARWRAAGEPTFPSGESDHRFRPGTFPFEDLTALPLSPPQLYERLRRDVEGEDEPVDVAVFERIGELLARGDASAQLRASLYRVAGQLPRVELIGDYLDPLGRDGTAVALRYDSQGTALRQVLVFDEETSAMLAEETQLLEAASWIDAQVGDVIRSVAYVEYGVVASEGDRPVAT